MSKKILLLFVAFATASLFTGCANRTGGLFGTGLFGKRVGSYGKTAAKTGNYGNSGFRTSGLKTTGGAAGGGLSSGRDLSGVPEYSGPSGSSGSSIGSSSTYGSGGYSDSGGLSTYSGDTGTYNGSSIGGSSTLAVSEGFTYRGGYDASGNPVQGGQYSASGEYVGDTGGYDENGNWVGAGGGYNSQGVFFGSPSSDGGSLAGGTSLDGWMGGYDISGNYIGAGGLYDKNGQYVGDTGGYDQGGNFVGAAGSYSSTGQYYGSSLVSEGPSAGGGFDSGNYVDGGAYGSGSSFGGPVEIRSVLFGYDRSQLSGNELAVIQAVADRLQSTGGTVTLTGHADERGSRAYNLSLGERRANAVKDTLVNYGIDPNRITTISYGSEQPLNNSHNESAWSENRRVEFLF